MKLILPLLLFSLINCNSQQIEEVSYLRQTRGFYHKITASAGVLSVQKERNQDSTKSYDISNEQWIHLQELISKIDVENIDMLETSTEGQQVDAAMSGQLSIIVNSNSFTSSNFDNDKPPKELEAIVLQLIQLAQIMD